MKKSIFKKIGGLFLGLAMGLGVAVGVTAGNKASEVKAIYTEESPYTYTLGSTDFTTNGGTKTSDGVKWTASAAKYIGSGTAGVQIGSGNSPQKEDWTISAPIADFGSVKVTQVDISIATASKGDCSWKIEAGTNSASGTTGATTTNVTKSLANASATSGDIKVTLNSNAKSKAIYLKSIKVTFIASGGPKVDVTGVALDKTSATVLLGKSLELTATCSPENASDQTVNWDSSNTSVATVANGVVTPLTEGTTTITATTTDGGFTASCVVTVEDPESFNPKYSNSILFKDYPGISEWGTSYSFKTISDENVDVEFSSANYPASSSSVTNMPVTKGSDIVITAKDGKKLSSVEMKFVQWGTKTHTITLKTTNDGTTWTNTDVSSDNFYFYKDSLGDDVTGLTVCFSGSDQIGVLGLSYELGNTKTLKSIAVTTSPTKTSYNAGEKFQTTGMVVKATYGNSQGSDTTETITGYTCNPSTSTALTSSNDKVTISYTEGGVTKTTDVAIDVAYFDGIKITTAASKTSYHDGEKFDVSGLVVKAVTKHSSGIADDEVDVTSSVTYKIGTSAATPGSTEVKKGDNQTVTISYSGKSVTYTINCGYAYVTGVEFGVAPETMGPGDTYSPTATVSPLTAEQGKTFTVESQTEGVLVEFDGETLTISNGTAEGSVTLLVTSTGKKENGESATDEVTISVSAAAIPQLTGFAITGTATKATQYLNDTFELDLSGLTITGKYDIENPNPETFGIEDFLWDTDSYGYPYGIYLLNDNLDISLEGHIELVEDFCKTIEFVNEDITNKTYYTTDESFDHTGLSISGKMASGADAVIDTSKVKYIFSKTPAELGAGTGKSVSVHAKYGDAETDPITISGIEVKEIVLESISVTTKPSKLTYTIGESFSSTGIVVKGINNDGSDAGDLTSQCTFEYAETAFLTKGNPTITVKYGNKTATFTIEVNEKTLQPGTSKWTLVENINDLEIGDQIIITNSGHSQALGGQNSNNRGQVGVTYANNELTIGDSSPAILELKAGNKDGTYSFYDSTNSGYLYAASSGSNYLKVESSLSDNSSFILTTKSAIAQGTNTRNSIRYNSNSSCFSCYSSGQAEINFFVQEVTPGESRTLAGITATYNHTGDIYYTGDDVVSADFTVKAWYNNGDTVNNVSGFTITDSTLVEGNNTIELSYEGKKCTVLVSDIETRTATVDHVYVETETGYQVNYYLDGATAAWKLEKINVVAYWTDGTTSTSSLSDLVESGDVTLSKSSPEVGDTSFTVSGSYYGTAIDSTHNSVTVSVVAKEITSLNWAKRFDGYSFNVFEGDTINKSAFAKQNSSSYIKANFNDGTSDETYSIDNCSVALYRREGSSNIKVKDVKFDANGNYTFEAEDDGLYFLLTAGGKTTQYSDAAVFSVCERLNAVNVPGNDITKTITTSSFSPALKTSTAGTGESTAEGITFTYDGLYDYTSSSKHHIALPKKAGAYFASSKLPGDLKSIQITKGGQNINSAATLYISKDGNTWDTAKAFGNTEFTYSVTGEGYRYFKIVTDGSNYTNIGSLIVKYSGNTDVANTDSVTQKSVIEFAKYFYEELSEVCNSFDTTSDAFKEAWGNVASKYNEMFGSSSTIEGLDKTLAANMFKYAYPNGRVGEETDVLQLAMQRYDTIVARDANLSKFITRASSYNSPRVNNPIANLSNVDNSVWVISAVALVGLTAIGGYFFYRKRKEN